MILYEKKDKTRCSLSLFYRYHFFSRSFTNDCRSSTRERQETTKTIPNSNTPRKTTTASSSSKKEEDINPELVGRPIIDISGWQLLVKLTTMFSPKMWRCDRSCHSGAQAKKENAATHLNGLDKSYKTHIQEFQKRNIPVAVYAYVAAKDKKEMEKEAEEFYKAASPYKPTYYWLDVEEKTMKDMNAGVEAFRAKLQALGAKNIGIYIGTYFMEEHSISTDKFTALWIPTYGFDDGYYNAAPDTNTEYDLHQYTSQGQLNGFSHYLDLNQIAPTQDQEAIYRKLFKVQKDNSSS